jgi:hypothetical protein
MHSLLVAVSIYLKLLGVLIELYFSIKGRCFSIAFISLEPTSRHKRDPAAQPSRHPFVAQIIHSIAILSVDCLYDCNALELNPQIKHGSTSPLTKVFQTLHKTRK